LPELTRITINISTFGRLSRRLVGYLGFERHFIGLSGKSVRGDLTLRDINRTGNDWKIEFGFPKIGD
jgi:hypothetical protein